MQSTRKRDLTILGLAFALVVLSMVYLARLTPNETPTIEQVLPPAQVAELQDLRGRYGDGDDFAVVFVRSPTATIEDARLAELENALASIPGAARTWSRLTRPRLEYDGLELHVVTRPLTAADTPLRLDRFLTPDPRSAVILLGLSSRAATLTGARTLSEALERVLARERARGDEAYAVGSPLLRVATWDAAARDARRMLPVLALVVVVVPFVFFRSLWASLFPFVLAALASGATLALNRVVNGATSPWMLVLLPLVWSVATMDAMHFYESARRRRGAGDDASAARVLAARKELLLPCLLTAATTALSLAVLAAPGGPALFRSVGAWGALGTMIAYALTFALGGPLLRLMNDTRPPPAWPTAIARRLLVASGRRPAAFVVAWLVLAGVAAVYVPRISIESRYPRVFADGAGGAFERDLRELPAALDTDLLPLEIHLEGTTDHAREPESLLLVMLGLHQYLGTLPDSRLSLSAATLIDEWTQSDPRAPAVLARAAYSVDRKQKTVALLSDPRVMHWVRADLGTARVQALFAKTSYARKDELLHFITHFVEAVYPQYRVRFSGPLFVYHVAEREGVNGIVQGAGLDLALIALTFALVFRRTRATLSAVLVNVVPVVILLGVMAIAKVPWSLGLLGLPVVVLGLAVDDTTHLLWEARSRRSPALASLIRAMHHSGTAVISTCALLAGCLAALSRSGFQVNHELGILLPLGLGIALAAELTLLPALLMFGLRAASRRSARPSR